MLPQRPHRLMTPHTLTGYNGGMSTTVSPVATKAEVMDLLRRHADDIQRLGVERIGLFGSFVREEQTAESDVDVLVKFAADQKTFDHFMDLCFLLEDLFGRKVDVLTVEYLSPFFGPHILNEVEYLERVAGFADRVKQVLELETADSE
jgi:predicted nucleotidyltransferase